MKFKLFLLAAFVSTAMFAQIKPKVTSAVLAYDKSDFAQAKKKIDEAEVELIKIDYKLDDEKTMSKFYYYKGQVYLGILYSKDPEVNGLDSLALDKSIDGYTKLFIHEKGAKKPRFTKDAARMMPSITNALARKGSALDGAKDYEGAKNTFLQAYELGKDPVLGDFAKTDTSMLYNSALMSMKGANFADAADAFQQLLDMNYAGIVYSATDIASGEKKYFGSRKDAETFVARGAVKDVVPSESLRNSLYLNMISCYKQAEDMENFKGTLTVARKEFPGDVGLINLEIQEYLDNKDYEKALAVLDEAIAASPENELYYYVKGGLLLNQKKDSESALAMYNKAVELKPDYTDALYMGGLVYFNQAKEITEEINALPGSAVKKYDALKKKQKETFKLALPYFEKALESSPEDPDTLKALREVYYKIGDTENYKRINAMMK